MMEEYDRMIERDGEPSLEGIGQLSNPVLREMLKKTWEKAQEVGEMIGYDAGSQDGESLGHEAGRKEGAQEGRMEGYGEGYRGGEEEGLRRGHFAGKQECERKKKRESIFGM